MNTVPPFSDEELAFLRHEAFMAEVMKLRTPKRSVDEKPGWLQVLESSVVTTLITVVLGGIVGNLVVSSYQDRRKQAEQALAEYRQYLQKEEGIVRHAYEMLGAGVFNAQRTLDLTKPWFQVENYSATDQPLIKEQRTAVIKERNDFLAQWEKEREHIGFLLSYYHYGKPEVATAWEEVQHSLDELIACSHKHYVAYLQADTAAEDQVLCETENTAYSMSLRGLAAQITAAREYSWQQLGIPKRDEPGAAPLSEPATSALTTQ